MLLLAAISKATRAQLLLRWPRNVDQVKFSLSSGVGLPAFNALILEYCHKSHIADLIPKAGFYFFYPAFVSRSGFDHFNVIVPQSYRIR